MEIKGYFIGASLKGGRQGTGSHATQHPSLFYSLFQLFLQKSFYKLFPRQKSFIIFFLEIFFTSNFVHTYGCFLSQEAC